MDPAPAPEPFRVTWLRGAIAFGVFSVLLLLTIGYHDGAFGTKDVTATDLVKGSYRFKGTVEAWDPDNQTFRLRDETGAREFAWNVTDPKVGETYVVDADVSGEGHWRALALTKTILIDGRWT